MEDLHTKAAEITAKLSLDEKAKLLTGKDFWHLASVPEYGLPEIMVTDGPSGLRKQCADSDMLGINQSVPATCMPGACTTACSFDLDVTYKIGQALGDECRKEHVSVILGPGVNIKRSPLCGRNFEYFSEDPLLAGEMGAGLINGVQSKDIGTSMKHFACNSQETRRMVSDSIVDDRALHELYLANFETAVKKAQPWTIMYAYNRVNGTYCYENKEIITDELKNRWGFRGLTVSDWGACGYAPDAVAAGNDLEMPGPVKASASRIKNAIAAGTLTQQQLDTAVSNVVELILKSKKALGEPNECDMLKNHETAVYAAEQSMVLLKNEGNILPLAKDAKIAVIGRFAKAARYQGAGSSQVNAYKKDEVYDVFKHNGINIDYADGYADEASEPDTRLIAQACSKAAGKDAVIIFAGLPASFESEGFDRKDMKIPNAHIQLIKEVAKVNPNVVVVLMGGSPMELDFADDVKGMLLAYLGGQGVGRAVFDLLYGNAVPSGKLAETWGYRLEDNPTANCYLGGRTSVYYKESIFVGYRYYETAKKPVRYPFGYGLSYSSFEYSDLKTDKTDMKDNDELTVTFSITNTGKYTAKEAAQVYVSHKNEHVYMPALTLAGFTKPELAPGETKTVSITLSKRAFAYYNTLIKDWYVDEGDYEIKIGKSCEDIVLGTTVHIVPEKTEQQPDFREKAPAYYELKNEALSIPDSQFREVYGKELPPLTGYTGRPFNRHSTIGDLECTGLGKVVNKVMDFTADVTAKKNPAIGPMMQAMVKDMPLRGITTFLGSKVSDRQFDGVVDICNGEYVSGIKKISSKD